MRGLAGAVVLMLGLGLGLAACDEASEAQAPPAPPPPTVGIVAAHMKGVTRGYDLIGRVESIETVNLLARVDGFLETQNFREGQDVKKGDLLFTIEKDMFQALVDQANADVAAAEAAVVDAEAQYQRGLALLSRGNMAQAQVDTLKATRDQAQASVLQTQAQLRQAQINLGYTDIISPVEGQIGAVSVDVGNYVTPASGTLVTVVSQDPMYVTFPVSQAELLEIRRNRAEEDGGLIKIQFALVFSDGTEYAQKGRWDFTSPQVDQTTDTILMRATIPNPERLLVDGQYANVILEERDPQQRLVVPQAAIQTDQTGRHVLVVGADNKVETRPVETGPNDGIDVVIVSGLNEGERVIVDGLQKVRPGQVVNPVEAQQPSESTETAGAAGPPPAAPAEPAATPATPAEPPAAPTPPASPPPAAGEAQPAAGGAG